MIRVFAAFFAFGATMCTLTIVLLVFPRKCDGFALASQSRSSPRVSIIGQRSDLAHVCGRDRLRFRSNRTLAKVPLGDTNRVSHSVAQHYWRSVQRSRSARLPRINRVTHRRHLATPFVHEGNAVTLHNI